MATPEASAKATRPTTIAADVSQRGPFEADLFFNVPGGGNAFIQVNRQSPRDGGMLHVEGTALASFEQGLLIEVYDAEGNVVASQAAIVNAPDLGQPGPYAADLPYSVAASGPGRVVVRDVSPAFGGDVHLASVEVDPNP